MIKMRKGHVWYEVVYEIMVVWVLMGCCQSGGDLWTVFVIS